MTLAAFRAAAEAELAVPDEGAFFSSAHWLVPWLDHYARDTDRFVDSLPMMVRKRRLSALPVRELRFVGSGDDERDEVCTEFADLHDEQGALLPAVLASRDWDLCSVENVAADSHIGELMAQAGAFVCEAGTRYRIALPNSVDAWEETLGKSSRAKVRRTRRYLQTHGMELVQASGEQALTLLPALIELHQARWRSQGRPGVFASDRFRAFHQQLLSRPESPAHIALLRDGSTALAGWYGFDYGSSRYFYQSGFTPQAQGHFSPGLALHVCMVEGAIAAGLRWYDFMKGGEQSYKSRFGAETSPVWHWRLPGNSLRGRVLAMALARSPHWRRGEGMH